jgi:tetratricopeptide (TPR) repeat protein
MDAPVLCSTEEFIAKSNEIIISPFKHGYYSICSIYREHGRLEREASNEALANALDLTSAICSMMLRPNSANEPFQPFMQLEGKRSAIADDFTREQLEFIAKVFEDMNEPLVKARFADLLWLCVNPKRVGFVRTAIQNYLMLPIDPETWHYDIGDCWKRCIRLARQIRDSESIGIIEATLQSAFKKDYLESPFMHLWIAELIEGNRLCTEQHGSIAEALFEHATRCHHSGGYREAREYLSLAERMFKAQDKEDNWLNCLVLSADCFELEGDFRCDGSSPSQMVANSSYENALQSYRKIPAAKRDELSVTAKLVSIRCKITEAGSGSLSEIGLVKTPGIDISEIIDGARKHVGGKDSLELSLLCFTGFAAPKYQALRARTIELIQQFPLSNSFGGTHMAVDGRVIAKTPALNFDGEENELVIINKTIQSFQLDLELMVEGQIVPALNQILSEFRVTKDYLKQICYHSPIVPESREYLMASALWSGFEHDFSNGIHLLAPQVEHLVRTILKNKGVHTSNIDRYGIENENGLTTLLNHERVEEVLGEDLLFELKAVFTESVGPNLRNEVAHGLLSDQSSRAIACVYSWWMVLRLVVRSLYEFETDVDSE